MNEKNAKNAALIRHLQNISIAALALSAIFLLMQTPLFGDLAGKTPYELAQELLADDTVSEGSVTADPTELALPVCVVYTSEYARFGLDSITTLDEGFEQAGIFFSEALGSAEAFSSCQERELLAALHASGLYLDLDADTSLELLAGILGVTAPDTQLLRVTRLLLCPAEDGGAVLYLQDRDAGCFSSRTAVSSSALSASLAALDGNGADFAFSLPGDYEKLSPYTLILSEPAQRFTLSSASALTDFSEFLRLAEFNPHTSGYTDSSGTTVIQEVYGTLRLQADGSVSYQGDSAESGSLYYVSSADSGKPTMTEAVSAAQRLAFTLLRNRCGDAELYLSGCESSGRRYTVTFDYVVDGTTLRFADGSHAASVTVDGQAITAFSLHCRSYTLSDTPALLLPIRQAAAIAAERYLNAELRVCYDDRGADAVGVSWFGF